LDAKEKEITRIAREEENKKIKDEVMEPKALQI